MDHQTAVVPAEETAHSASSPSFIELAGRHRALEEQLQKLIQKRYLSAEEELEAVRLKKEKLHLKDEMMLLRKLAPAAS